MNPAGNHSAGFFVEGVDREPNGLLDLAVECRHVPPVPSRGLYCVWTRVQFSAAPPLISRLSSPIPARRRTPGGQKPRLRCREINRGADRFRQRGERNKSERQRRPVLRHRGVSGARRGLGNRTPATLRTDHSVRDRKIRLARFSERNNARQDEPCRALHRPWNTRPIPEGIAVGLPVLRRDQGFAVRSPDAHCLPHVARRACHEGRLSVWQSVDYLSAPRRGL